MLSTIEALAAALYIIGLKDEACILLSKIRWGHTFLNLNCEPLDLYSSANDASEIERLERDYSTLCKKMNYSNLEHVKI